MTEIPEFEAAGWFELHGHRVAAFTGGDALASQGCYRPGQLMGRHVRIDGMTYMVTGVESHPIGGVSETNPYQLPFSLMVDDLPQDAKGAARASAPTTPEAPSAKVGYRVTGTGIAPTLMFPDKPGMKVRIICSQDQPQRSRFRKARDRFARRFGLETKP